jgi:hypothetical protein
MGMRGPGQPSHDRELSSGNLRGCLPGHLLVVELVVAEGSRAERRLATGERAERLIVGFAFGALPLKRCDQLRLELLDVDVDWRSKGTLAPTVKPYAALRRAGSSSCCDCNAAQWRGDEGKRG